MEPLYTRRKASFIYNAGMIEEQYKNCPDILSRISQRVYQKSNSMGYQAVLQRIPYIALLSYEYAPSGLQTGLRQKSTNRGIRFSESTKVEERPESLGLGGRERKDTAGTDGYTRDGAAFLIKGAEAPTPLRTTTPSSPRRCTTTLPGKEIHVAGRSPVGLWTEEGFSR